MMIGSISSINSITPAFNPVLAVKPAPAVTNDPVGASASGASASAQLSIHPPAAPASTPVQSTYSGGAASAVEQVIGVYSTTLGGQQYAGTVEESDGVYTVSMPALPRVSATGNSELAAENSLDRTIDELV